MTFFHRVTSWSAVGLQTLETPVKLSRRTIIDISGILYVVLETFIYRISPEVPQTLLATPNWPQGMKPSSTVSWVVSVPSQYEAHLRFTNVSQPKCDDRHTAIKVMLLGEEEELLSRREDESKDYDLRVPQSFYLNMSNCIPQEGQFKAVVEIALQKKSSEHLNSYSICTKRGFEGFQCTSLLLLLLFFLCRLVAHYSGGSRSSSAVAYSAGCRLHPEKVRRLAAAGNPELPTGARGKCGVENELFVLWFSQEEEEEREGQQGLVHLHWQRGRLPPR